MAPGTCDLGAASRERDAPYEGENWRVQRDRVIIGYDCDMVLY